MQTVADYLHEKRGGKAGLEAKSHPRYTSPLLNIT